MCLSLFLGYADLSFLTDLEPNTTCPLYERALDGSVLQRVPISQDGNTHRCPPRQGDYSPTATDAPWLKRWFLTTIPLAGRSSTSPQLVRFAPSVRPLFTFDWICCPSPPLFDLLSPLSLIGLVVVENKKQGAPFN